MGWCGGKCTISLPIKYEHFIASWGKSMYSLFCYVREWGATSCYVHLNGGISDFHVAPSCLTSRCKHTLDGYVPPSTMQLYILHIIGG